MIKNICLLFIFSSFSLFAEAKSVLKTYEDFVHLPDYQKKQIIIKTMELMVDLEDRYLRETQKYGYRSERFELFETLITKISQGLISSAKAQEIFNATNDWQSLVEEFKKSQETSGENKCVFAGWMSTTYTKGSSNFCMHPSRNKNVSYPKSRSGDECKSGDLTKIQCSPLIFGYKNISKGSSFCVSTNEYGKNSSYHCMKKALGEEQEADADSKETRLNFLKENLEKNPQAFKVIQDYVYKACLCETPKGFNVRYQKAINNHRTCYGLMRTISSYSCDLTGGILPRGLENDYLSVFNSLKNKLEGEERTINKQWTQLRLKESQTQEYKNSCGPAPELPPQKYICEVRSCQGEGKDRSCDFSIKKEGASPDGPDLEFSDGPNITGEIPKEGSFTVNFTPLGGPAASAECSIPEEEVVVNFNCTVSSCEVIGEGEGEGKERTCDIQITQENSQEELEFSEPPAPKEGSFPKQGDFTAVFKLKSSDKQSEVTCTMPEVEEIPEEDLPKGPDLEVVIKQKRAKSYVVQATFSNAQGWTFSWESEKASEAPVDESLPGSDVATRVAGGDEEEQQEDGSGTRTTNQIRLDQDYKVFGILTKGEKTIKKDVTIDKVEASQEGPKPLPKINPNLRPQGPQMMIRGTSDSSAGGVR